MSNYAWEKGTISLPASAVTPVKKTVRDTHEQLRRKVLEVCEHFWDHHAKRTRSTKKYEEAISQWWNTGQRSGYSHYRSGSPLQEQARKIACDVIEDLACKPRKVKLSDLEPYGLGKLTNRDTRIALGHDAAIIFDGRTVTWLVPENNHAVEDAHDHPVAIAFFGKLSRVSWTRGSGGVIIGNSENNCCSDYAGGGANYISMAFGPAGEKERRFEMGLR